MYATKSRGERYLSRRVRTQYHTEMREQEKKLIFFIWFDHVCKHTFLAFAFVSSDF